MTAGSLAGRPDSDVVEFPNHRRMRVGDLRRFEAAAKKLRQAGAAKPLPPGLRAAPSGAGTKVSNAGDVSTALKRPGNETLQLPSGKRLTADQLRFLLPEIEKRLGRRLDAPASPPSRSGPAIHVSKATTKAEWKEILRKPDRTVLESPSGKRITVGEIRKAFPGGGDSGTPGRSRSGKP